MNAFIQVLPIYTMKNQPIVAFQVVTHVYTKERQNTVHDFE